MGELRQRGRIWWLRYYRNGRRFEESSHSEKQGDAARLLKQREGDIAARTALLRLVVTVVVAIVISGGCSERGDSGGASSECVFQARAILIGEDSPIRRELWTSDQVVLRNEDTEDWTDVEVAIYGWLVIPAGKSRTGRYTKRLSHVAAKRMRMVSLADFRSAKGEAWVPMTMKLEALAVQGKMGGRLCKAEDVTLIGGGAEK